MNQSLVKTQAPAPAEDVISLSEIFMTLNNYKWPIIGFTISSAIVATLVAYSLTPIYQSTAVLEIEQKQANVVSIEEIYGVDVAGDSYLNTQYEVLKSRSLISKVVDDLKLLENPEFNASLRPERWYAKFLDWRSWFGIVQPVDESSQEESIRNNTINALTGNISIELVKKTQIIKIKALSENPRLSAQIANAMANAYIGSFMEARFALTTNATSWMQVRLEELSNKLAEAEQALQAYREEQNLIELEGVLTLSNNELTALTDSLVKERQTLAVTENIYRQIQNGKGGRRDLSSLPAVMDHPLIVELKQEESKVEREVDELSRRYLGKHPTMIAAQSELASIRNNINAQINRILNGIESQYQVAKANEASLSKAVAAARSKVQDINRKQFRLQALEREVKTNKDLYDTFFKRIQESNATVDLDSSNARIVDKAYPANGPVKPKKQLIVVLATLLGMMIATGIAFILEMMNNTIRTMKDVEDRLNLPVLGMLPTISKKNDKEIQQLFNDAKEFAFGEAVRTIRTSMTLTSLDKNHKVFAVTSSLVQEGKSTTSCNTALSLGQLGKTIIIDCDMRRPTLGKRMGLKGGLMGLSNLLNGSSELDECIHKVGNVDIIPAGVVPPNPQELLASDNLDKVIRELRQRYDYVILDCPPLQNLSDTLMLAKVSDGYVYVIESGRVQIPMVAHSIGRLLQARANVIGVVLNKVNPKRKDQYGSNYGYYGYGNYTSSVS